MRAKRLLALAIGTLVVFAGSSLPAQAVLTPAGSSAVMLQPGVTYHYRYLLSRVDGMGLERSGNLTLRFSANGIISGYYGFDDDFPTIPVTGTQRDGTFWLDIGSNAISLLHVNGAIGPDGALSAYAFRTRSSSLYKFSATLNRSRNS
jgi:hypothetical protein